MTSIEVRPVWGHGGWGPIEVPEPFELDVMAHRDTTEVGAWVYGRVVTEDHPLSDRYVWLSKRHQSMESTAFNILASPQPVPSSKSPLDAFPRDLTEAGFAEILHTELQKLSDAV